MVSERHWIGARLSFGEPRVRAVGFLTQEPRLDQLIENDLTHGPLNTTQSLCLRERQSQTWHLQVFGADPGEQDLLRHGSVSPRSEPPCLARTFVVRLSRDDIENLARQTGAFK
jgi:hypothetical protein